MPELFRFRLVRSIQRQRLEADRGIRVAEPDQAVDGADLIDPQTWGHWLAALSGRLASSSDLVTPDTLPTLLPDTWSDDVAAVSWNRARTALGNSLLSGMRAMARPPTRAQVTAIEALMRLLRLHALITTFAADQQAAPEERQLRTARDVQVATQHEIVIVPTASAPRAQQAHAANLVRKPGFTDFYTVTEEWNRYVPGELAKVINVLPGEVFDARVKHAEETTRTTSTTTQTTTTDQTQNSQTQSSTLAQTTTKNSSLSIGVQGQVQTSGQYGPTHVDTNLGAQLQTSTSDSESKALTTSNQVVQTSVKEVSQSVVTTQTLRTQIVDSTAERHRLSNENGEDVTVGLYRWLSEVRRVRLDRYPHRFVIEFEIPEPGAWLRWAMQNAPVQTFNPDPGPFRLPGAARDLQPIDVDAQALAILASQWRIQGLDLPPPATVTLSTKLTVDPATQNGAAFAIASDNSLTVPNGYQADAWNAQVFATRNWGQSSYGTMMTVTVGSDNRGQATTGDMGNGAAFAQGTLSGDAGAVGGSTIPITVYTIALQGFTCNVNVTCNLTADAYRKWQQLTFDQIAAAYQALLQAYQQELMSQAMQPGALAGLSGPPELNAERATRELRRLVIEQLVGAQFDGTVAIVEANTGEPNVNLQQATAVAPMIAFFEQCFEWNNLVYICYPHYWGRRQTWPRNALFASADPEFDRFLNSGSVRVVVPARPGFEEVVNFYLQTGIVWSGAHPPAVGDADYLSIAQEIQALQTGANDRTAVGSTWEITVPTTLLWAGNDPATLPVNQNATIAAPG